MSTELTSAGASSEATSEAASGSSPDQITRSVSDRSHLQTLVHSWQATLHHARRSSRPSAQLGSRWSADNRPERILAARCVGVRPCRRSYSSHSSP
jgi:hypothetical protein